MANPEKYLAAEHVSLFREAAKRWQVWILVRSQNPASKQYIGRGGYIPKRLDCKAKTAKFDVPKKPPYPGMYKLAGLVADPTIHPQAFRGDALTFWNKFLPHVYVPKPGEQRTYLPAGILYSIELEPSHEHYGCVYFTSFGLATKKLFVYGDYDLYGLVSAKDPSVNLFVEEIRLGEKHSRSPEFFDVQHYLNSRMGVPMIQHGAQESYSAHTDEEVLIFWPDGITVSEAHSKAEIEAFYSSILGGRQTHQAGASSQTASGLWKKA